MRELLFGGTGYRLSILRTARRIDDVTVKFILERKDVCHCNTRSVP